MIAKLKSPTVHAIRILRYVADHPEGILISEEISRDLDIANSYFMRVVRDLRKAGIIKSIQGRYGGFVLCRAPEDISLYDIVEAMEEVETLREGPGVEPVSTFLDKINNDIVVQLKEISLTTL